MRKYCKAYYLKEIRSFSDWAPYCQEEEANLTGDDVVYLWDDFTVVKSPVIPDKGLLWDNVTPEWQDFCKVTLQFEIPEDLRYAYEQNENADRENPASVTVENPASV